MSGNICRCGAYTNIVAAIQHPNHVLREVECGRSRLMPNYSRRNSSR